MSPDARVVVTVAADPATAFRIFTEETDLWWRRGPRWRFLRASGTVLRFVPGVGGQLVEVDPTREGVGFVVGEVTAWEPGARLTFRWRLPNFAPGEDTEVDVQFEAVGDATRVTLSHRGLGALPLGHPARHGEGDRVFFGRIGRWWGELLMGIRERSST